MKRTIYYLSIVIVMLFLIGCTCPTCEEAQNQLDPIEDLSGYLDGGPQILYTTSADKDQVLDALNAEALSDGIYQLPVENILDDPFMMCFRVIEVENPYVFSLFEPTDPCFEDVLLSLYYDLETIIEGDLIELEEDVLLATGDALGQLTFEVGEDNDKRIRNGKAKDAKETKEKLKDIKKETKAVAKEATDKIKDKLELDDKEGAKEEGKKFIGKLKYKWSLGLKWDLDYRWCDSDSIPWYKETFCLPTPPDLIHEFIRNNLSYKVYSNAQCDNVDNPTMTYECLKIGANPVRYHSNEPVPTRSCIRGTNFCVEQEVISDIIKIHTDSSCVRLVGLESVRGMSCK